jgi:hypothetical protein
MEALLSFNPEGECNRPEILKEVYENNFSLGFLITENKCNKRESGKIKADSL